MNYTGGFLWMKKVADYVENSNQYFVLKSYAYGDSKKAINRLFSKICDLARIIIHSPDIAVIDAWGEVSIILWLILRIFQKNTKIFIVFHHYEQRISVCKNSIEILYNSLIGSITSIMLKNSDIILTVSKSSMHELERFYDIGRGKNNKNLGINATKGILLKNINWNNNDIAIVGTGIDIDLLNAAIQSKKKISKKKDIDFLCMGRIEKFSHLENIWMKIKADTPNSNIVMIGRADPQIIDKLLSMGIDHRGFVSEEEKMELYSRTKVFIFPSSREGFGIAVAEALFLGIPVIAWKIPVFEDLYSNNEETKIKLVELGNVNLFAEECIKAIDRYNFNQSDKVHKRASNVFPSCKTVSQNVISVIEFTK
jgi:glycosyltransferase involved in cell wall biosynthesis